MATTAVSSQPKAPAAKSRGPRKRRALGVHKPHGVLHPRVQKFGPEHFAIVAVDFSVLGTTEGMPNKQAVSSTLVNRDETC